MPRELETDDAEDADDGGEYDPTICGGGYCGSGGLSGLGGCETGCGCGFCG